MGKLGGLVALGLITLTGCSAPATSGQAPAVSATATATVTAAPIQAKAAPSSSASVNASGEITGDIGDPVADDFYLRSVRPAWHGEKPADAELISAAKLACERLSAGTPKDRVVVVTGNMPAVDVEWNNRKVVSAAGRIFCSSKS